MTVFGRITVVGNDYENGLVRDALMKVRGLPAPLETLLKRDYQITFKTGAQMIVLGAIIPGSKSPERPKGKAAWGYAPGRGVLWLNGTMAANSPGDIKYTAIHEIGHAIGGAYLTSAKRQELKTMLLARTKYGGYANQFDEAYADAFAEACGFRSPLDDFYRDFADENLPKLVEITFRDDPGVVDPVPVPVPLPLPDPELVELRARVEMLLSELDSEEAYSLELQAKIDAARDILG